MTELQYKKELLEIIQRMMKLKLEREEQSLLEAKVLLKHLEIYGHLPNIKERETRFETLHLIWIIPFGFIALVVIAGLFKHSCIAL